jgi:hypothetical protein
VLTRSGLPAWLPFPFPNLVTLDLTSNSPLAHMPLSFIHLPITKIHLRATGLAESNFPLIRSTIPSQRPPPRLRGPRHPPRKSAAPGPPTLLHLILRLYATTLQPHHPLSELSGLPPQLIDMLRETYVCELCYDYQYSDERDWCTADEERGWIVDERESGKLPLLPGGSRMERDCVPTQVVKVRGRVCKVCKDVYLRPRGTVGTR